MKRIILVRTIILLLCTFCIPSISVAHRIRVNGIIYKTISETEAEVVNGQYAPNDVVIPETVRIRGKEYKVIRIGDYAFQSNFHINSIEIPNSVQEFGIRPFGYCRRLTRVVVPDQAALISTGASKSCIFHGCNKLMSITGNTVSHPKWLIDHLNMFDNGEIYNRAIQKNNFQHYAEERISEMMEIWQQKKEYETTAQWKQRVTEESREKHLKIVEQQVVEEFVAKQGLKTVKGTIGYYDADYNIYPITAANSLGTFYLQVPIDDAPTVKNNWENVLIEPTYGIVDGVLTIVAAECHLNNKTYRTVEVHDRNAMGTKIELPPLQFDVTENEGSNVDEDIPLIKNRNKTTFAVIIGNENYNEVAKVPYALNDAQIFAMYCNKTLGIPSKNIKIYKDATYGTMLSAMENIQEIAKAYHGEINVIFYYAGHGIPDEMSKDAYLLPVDANGRNIAACYPLEQLYGELKKLNAKQVVVFLDACFSGAQRGVGMLASSRGVAIAAKKAVPQGNMVVFSAASADETAYPYNEKGHGLFTYYLLKKLNETKGDVTLGELGSYICEKVAQEAVVTNGKSQTPSVIPSAYIDANWESLKLIK